MIYKAEFYHIDHQKLLSNHFLENDWVWLYRKYRKVENGIDVYYRYFAYLATPIAASHCIKSATSDIEENNRVCLINGYKYRPYAREGFEHLVTIRDFKVSNTYFKDIRIAEEIIFYHRLYERRENNTIKYYQLNENIETLVCIIEENSVKILARFLSEYMAAKCMDLVCHCQSEVEFSLNDYNPRFKIRCTPGLKFQNLRLTNSSNFELCVAPHFHIIQSWFNGKQIFRHISLKRFFDNMHPLISFIIGTDDNGLPIKSTPDTSLYTPVFFSKNVQAHYGRQGYKSQELRISGPNFSLRCDNDNDEYIIAFLKDILDLPYTDQCIWLGYNIPPDGRGFSSLFQSSIIEGNWNGIATSIDFVFRDLYKTFLSLWEKKYNDIIIKPLNGVQTESLEKICIVFNNDYEALITLIRNLSLCLQESFNSNFLSQITPVEEKITTEIKDGIEIHTKKTEASISHFHRVCGILGIEDSKLNTFLKNLQTLRSYTLHRNKTEIKKDIKKAFDFFGLKYDHSNSTSTSHNILQIGVDALTSFIKQL